MSSTEAEPHTTDSWGIDWRKAHTWTTLVSVSLQLGLIAAMAVLTLLGLGTWALPDWPSERFLGWAFPAAFGLSWFLFHGWAIREAEQSGKEVKDRSSIYEAGSKADRIIYWCWSSAMLFLVVTLSVAFLELFDLHKGFDHLSPGLAALPPAIYLGLHGFPYVLDRLRRTANSRRST